MRTGCNPTNQSLIRFRINQTDVVIPQIAAYPKTIVAYPGQDAILFCNSTVPVRLWRIYVDGRFLKTMQTASVVLPILAARQVNLTHYTCEAELSSGNILRLDVPLIIIGKKQYHKDNISIEENLTILKAI